MIKKIVKYSLSLLAVLLVLLLLAPFFLNIEDYKQQIEQQVEDSTGHHLKIGGLKASLFPWVGVTLDDVVLANRLGFVGGDLLTVKHLDVQVALLPLLSQQLEIKRFTLDTPAIFLQRNAQGQGNWEDLVASSDMPVENKTPKASVEAHQEAPEHAFLSALSAESISLNHGRLIWQDDLKQTHIALTDIDLALDDVQLEHPVQVKLSAKLNNDAFTLKAQVGPVGDLAALDVQYLPMQLQFISDGVHLSPFVKSLPEALGDPKLLRVAMDMQLEQRPDGVRLWVGDVKLKAAQTLAVKLKLEMPDMQRLLIHQVDMSVDQDALLSLQGEISQLLKAPHYQLRLQSKPLQREKLAQYFPQLKSMYAGHPAAWKQIKLGASLSGTRSRLDVRDMQLLLDEELLQASGSVRFAKNLDVRMRLASKALHLDAWLPQPVVKSQVSQTRNMPNTKRSQGASIIAKQSADTAVVEPDLRFMKDWQVSLQLQVDQLWMRGLDMKYVRGHLKGKRGLFKLDPLQFNLADGQVRETASLNVKAYPVRWTESVHVSGMKLSPVLQALLQNDMLDGTMQLDTQLHATGLLPQNSMASLGGSGQMVLRDGRIKGIDIAGSLRNLSSLSGKQVNKYTDFAQFQASFTIKHGLLKNDDLFMASPLFRLTGQGKVNLPAANLDYHVRPKLVGSLLGQGDTLVVRKGLSVPLHIYGSFASPSIKPELDAQSLVENVGGVLGSGGGKISGVLGSVGALLGGSKTPKGAQHRAPAQIKPSKRPAQQPVTPQRQIDPAQKVLEGLLGL